MVCDPLWARAQCSAPSGSSAHMQRQDVASVREKRGREGERGGLERGKRQGRDGNGGKETL